MTRDILELHELPDRIFLCLRGAYGHDWDQYGGIARRNQWGQPVDYLCVRCSKVRCDIYDANGNLSYRYYDVPDDHPTVAAHTTSDVRLELVRRLRKKRTALRSVS